MVYLFSSYTWDLNLGKLYGVKLRCSWECLGGTTWELEEPYENMMGTRKKERSPSTPFQRPKEKNLGPS
jgi:hypothetical protein